MSSDLSVRKSPEEVELEEKRRELEELTELLAERELELATLKSELAGFESEYVSRVGQRYAEIDEIEAAIAKCLSEYQPENEELFRQATEAQQKAEESAKAAEETDSQRKAPKEPPSEELKNLFREAAKAVHPDRATSEEERLKREKMMAEVNDAYQRGDGDRIREILQEWEYSPEAVSGEDVGAELIRVIRQINQVRVTIERIKNEISDISSTALAELKVKYEAATSEGRDLLSEMAAHVDLQIEEARTRLETLRGEI